MKGIIECSKHAAGCVVIAVILLSSATVDATAPSTPGAATAAPVRSMGIYRGRLVEFQNVDGWAIVEGDIILGRADELERAFAAPLEQPRAYTIGTAAGLWPKGSSGMFEVPYVIEVDPNIDVPLAIATFNMIFSGFMQFVPRTIQGDYVAFTLSLAEGSPACTSSVGRIGGRQVIIGPPECSLSTLIHEMGHTVGLWHEHQRPDRDQYLTWLSGNTAKTFRSDLQAYGSLSANRQTAGPYDFASIMHYGDFVFSGNFQPTLVTIPQGIEIGNRQTYSAADIDAVDRLYGAAPTAVTVTSDPPQLSVAVDGQVVLTPATFSWPLNSVHTLDVPQSGQTLGGQFSYVFGRWNVDLSGDLQASRTIVVAPGDGSLANPQGAPAVTVYTAYFVRLFPFTLAPTGDTNASAMRTSGSVSPPADEYPNLAGSYFRHNQFITLTATVADNLAFAGWFGTNFTWVKDGFGANPMVAYAHDFNTNAGVMKVSPYGSSVPFLRFRGRANSGVVDGFSVQLDDQEVQTPYASPEARFKAGETHQITAVATQVKNNSTVRYQFTDWDGSPTNPMSVVIPSTGPLAVDMTANYTAEYAVTIGANSSCAGAISMSPSSVDGFHPYGEELTVVATANRGWSLTGWTGDFAGSAAVQPTTVNGEVFATAQFNTVQVPFALTGLSRASVNVGEPEFDLTLSGTGFTGGTVVRLNNVVHAATLVDATNLHVHVVQADYAQPGEITASVANASGNCQNLASMSIPVRSSQAGAAANYQGLWWAAPASSESGWGINFAHQGDTIFASWFTYDLTGKGLWVVMTAPKTAPNTYSGTLYTTTGPAFNTVPFNPAQVTPSAVGNGTLTFGDANNATFSYAVNGIAQVKNITRQVFGPLPSCATATSSLAAATNYQDLWWAAPAGSESGWGINFTHQADTIFATWFTYDVDHSPMWLVATAPKTAPGVYSGTLYRTTGPAFNAVPFKPANVVATAVGMATLSFADGNNATFAYTVNGIAQNKAITREVFNPPGTVCH